MIRFGRVIFLVVVLGGCMAVGHESIGSADLCLQEKMPPPSRGEAVANCSMQFTLEFSELEIRQEDERFVLNMKLSKAKIPQMNKFLSDNGRKPFVLSRNGKVLENFMVHGNDGSELEVNFDTRQEAEDFLSRLTADR